ncbi:unnamed protein product [Linum tenue]|uniref:Secreted protein n=1 Tax=Linum tenue TaxID=586396 RepID=A0AAV0HGD3_9ROSI|nr:unnamed protein product [Linum tenue]
MPFPSICFLSCFLASGFLFWICSPWGWVMHLGVSSLDGGFINMHGESIHRFPLRSPCW